MRYVVVAAPPEVTVPEDVARLPACADLVELRLDLLGLGGPECEASAWLSTRPPDGLLVTLRSPEHGGRFAAGPEAAAAALSRWARGGEGLVDAEPEVLALLARQGVADLGPGRDAAPGRPRFVLSQHGSFGPPVPPPGFRVAVVKRAARVEDAADLAVYRAALREAPDPQGGRAIMPLGPLAALRVLDPHAALLYGSAGTAVVEGQPTLLALIDELRAGELTPRARLFGLLGSPPAASPSPMLHNAMFRSLGLDAVHVPLPGLALQTALTLPFQGFSVTTPFKARALELAEDADEAARAVGAANTLVRRPAGGWRALNTDVEALVASLPPAPPGAGLVVHGAGGYARAALAAAHVRGYAPGVVARDEARGRALAAALGARWRGTRYERDGADAVLLNATPAGSRGEPVAALDTALEGLTVLDAPYGEPGAPTWLVRVARERRAARVVEGLELLLAQAVGQARAFTGRAPDLQVLRLALRPRTSLVLAGLRGAGKSTVGRLVARRLGRPFVDLDAELERVGGEAPGALLERAGLDAFRRAERRAVERLSGRHGLVVATGGGVVEDPRNLPGLRSLGLCVWLEVPPETAAARVRADPTPRPPLIAGADPLAEATALLARRAPHYARLAHERVDAGRAPETVALDLVERWLRWEDSARR